VVLGCTVHVHPFKILALKLDVVVDVTTAVVDVAAVVDVVAAAVIAAPTVVTLPFYQTLLRLLLPVSIL
jgi:hypothetical protein